MVIQVLYAGIAFNAVGHIFVHFPLASIAELVKIPNQFHVWLGLDSWVQQDGEYVCRIDHEQDEDIHIFGNVIELFVATAPSHPLQNDHEEEEGVDEEYAGERG